METANERWKLFTFAGLTSCFILLLCLGRSRRVVNLWTLQNINLITIRSSSPTPNLQCNIFEGRWVYKEMEMPLYDESRCPFPSDQVRCYRNGRPDFDYQKWTWDAHGCEIPRFNGEEMLERLRGKRMIIVGDSLNRNQWESLACLLYSSIPPSRADFDFGSGSYKVFRAMDYNISVEFYWSSFLVQLDTEQPNGTRVLRLDTIDATAKRWQGADVMVFNTGHWWNLFEFKGKLVEEMDLETAFKMAMKTWARWIDENVVSTKTKVFFRSVSPQHKGKLSSCYNKRQPITNESIVNTLSDPLMEIAESIISWMRTPVRYLNITKLSGYRVDAHPMVYTTSEGKKLISKQKKPENFADCSHWCLPGLPDTWNRLLYASMVLDS
ncbi:hypothetical protein RJ639_014602 [Escallonia herrerae]|uniref:Trichome birefringence-like N-terminal domain-containing protein n=1 Tax=Escallonia herrerae TaxID=1293975 RepID=A0AA89AM45_9ASTE|nr:hypothetical protein RJ639_014602 [Escallonia herrerae]